jgi:hypothetical protein
VEESRARGRTAERRPAARPFSVVLVGGGCPEQREDAIAGQVFDVAAEPLTERLVAGEALPARATCQIEVRNHLRAFEPRAGNSVIDSSFC